MADRFSSELRRLVFYIRFDVQKFVNMKRTDRDKGTVSNKYLYSNVFNYKSQVKLLVYVPTT